jgi:hypothetical protein
MIGIHPLQEPVMRILPSSPASVLLFPLLLILAGCATGGGRNAADAPTDIPPEAVSAVRTMDNGDVVTEYRVAGQLRVLKVQPRRGPAYYLYDRNADGRVDEERGTSPIYFKLFEW